MPESDRLTDVLITTLSMSHKSILNYRSMTLIADFKSKTRALMKEKIYLQAKYLSFSSGTKAALKPRCFSLTSNETTQNFLRSIILFLKRLKTFEIPTNPNYINGVVCKTVKEMLKCR